jgi:hypothetical protein
MTIDGSLRDEGIDGAIDGVMSMYVDPTKNEGE